MSNPTIPDAVLVVTSPDGARWLDALIDEHVRYLRGNAEGCDKWTDGRYAEQAIRMRAEADALDAIRKQIGGNDEQQGLGVAHRLNHRDRSRCVFAVDNEVMTHPTIPDDLRERAALRTPNTVEVDPGTLERLRHYSLVCIADPYPDDLAYLFDSGKEDTT